MAGKGRKSRMDRKSAETVHPYRIRPWSDKAETKGEAGERPVSGRRILAALVGASAVCTLMAAARVLYMRELAYAWLIVPNLLLAWLPLLAAMMASRTATAGGRGAIAILWGILWLAFYPNAPYIATDFVHLGRVSTSETLYYDLSLNMLAATLGWLLGALSLRLVQHEVSRRFGSKAGIGFAAVVLLLGAVGVYLGRVQRLNSWDLAVRPLQVMSDVLALAVKPDAILFVVSFALLQAALYAVFCAFVPDARSLLPRTRSL